MVSYRVIGQPTPRVDGVDKVTGRARYTADMDPPGTIWGKVLHSPYPHARILKIDTTAARALPGVHAVITGADVDIGMYGRLIKDVPVLARDRVLFAGERVAAVAADDEDIAQRALDLIEVDYEELPALLEIDDALAPSAEVLHPDFNRYQGVTPLAERSNAYARTSSMRGDVDAGFAAADVVVENTYTTQRVHQAYLETQACLVAIEGGRVQVWTCSKVPYGIRDALAVAVGIPPETIVVNHVYIGGDFGGKGAPLDLPICYHLARLSSRPVRMVPDYIEELLAGNPRHATRIELKTGLKRDGSILAHQVRFAVNSGAYAGYKPRGVIGGANQAAGPYRIPATRIESVHVYTNTVPGGHFRAPGEPQAMFAIESHIDECARAIGMDPLAFRVQNLIREGDETPTGERLHDVRAVETVEAAARAGSFASSKPALVGRGVAIGHRGPGGGQGSAAVTLVPDGRVVLGTPIFDQGTGTYTTLRQVVAEELGIAPERVEIQPWDTDQLESDSGIGGSRGTRVNSAVAYEAAQAARQELVKLAVERLGWPEENTVLRGDQLRRTDIEEVVPWPEFLSSLGESVTGRAHVEDSSRAHITSFAAQVAEVSVDPETGEVSILKFTTAHDVGRILNPVGHQGQINGGFMQGLGFALMEEMKLEDGRVSTLSFGDYKIPTIRDIPPLQTVLLESNSGVGPYQIKGIGESPIGPVAPAIANAVFDAVGVRIRDLPITAEKVYRALKQKEGAGG